MTDEQKTGQSQFQAFLQQRNNKTNVALQEAQKMVNLYRVLNEFGPDFVDQYNKMLMNTSDEVQMALKALVGGDEVRQYLEYVKAKLETTDDKSKKIGPGTQASGYLPSPADEAVDGDLGTISGEYVSKAEWHDFVKQQKEEMEKMLADLKQEQQNTLTRLMDQLSMVPRSKNSENQPETPPPPKMESYSEIIEEPPKKGGF